MAKKDFETRHNLLVNSKINNVDIVKLNNTFITKPINEVKAFSIASSTTLNPEEKDFHSLHTALKYLETTIIPSNVFIQLNLEPGVHVLGGEGNLNEMYWCHYRLSEKNISISGDSDVWAGGAVNRGNYIITLDSYDDGDTWADIFSLYKTEITFVGLTIDTLYNGYPYNTSYIINGYMYSYIGVNGCDVKNGNTGVYLTANTYLSGFKSNFFNHYTPIFSYGSKGQLNIITITNTTRSLSLTNNSYFVINGITIIDTVANGIPIGIRSCSELLVYGKINISGVNKTLNGLRIDEFSKCFFDNDSVNELVIDNATTAILVEGGSYIGMEYNLPIKLSNCNTGFMVTNDGEIYLRTTIPEFTNVTTEYNVPLNTRAKAGMIRTENLNYMTSIYDNTNTELEALTEKEAIDELFSMLGSVSGSTSNPIEYNFTATANQTVFTLPGVLVTYLGVFSDGIKQQSNKYTITNTETDTIVTFIAGNERTEGTWVQLVRYN